MNDEDIRTRLRQFLDQRDIPYLEEVSLAFNNTRIDLVANMPGGLVGFEIKSEKDTLDRLPAQAKRYRRYFRRLVLVGSEGHLDGATKILPSWWGVWVVRTHASGVHIVRRTRLARSTRTNLHQRPEVLASLMRKADLLELMDPLGENAALPEMRRKDLAGRYASQTTNDEIEAVFAALVLRRADRTTK